MIKKAILLITMTILILPIIVFSDNNNNKDNWSSTDILTIPYDVRESFYKKENLVNNPSFENGNENPDAWTKIGKTCKYLDINKKEEIENEKNKKDKKKAHQADAMITDNETEYKIETLIHSGSKAIEIKSKNDEFDDEIGILSDFIPVIPGQYDFTAYLKFKNVKPFSSDRRLHDVIKIDVQFYDKNKKRISGLIYDEAYKYRRNAESKTFRFDRYIWIKDLEYSKVNLVTEQYPYPVGLIPSKTRYVKLFFGLKGKGEMWVDDVDFRYSKWNFTMKERINLKNDTSKFPNMLDIIIPTPKDMEKTNKIIYLDKKNKDENKDYVPIYILLTEKHDILEKISKELIIQIAKNICINVRYGLTDKIKIINKLEDIVIKNDNKKIKPLIISIGNTDLFKKNEKNLPIKKLNKSGQSYFIKTMENDDSVTVFLYGKEHIGTFYAATTFVQMLDPCDFVYYSADIIDYPSFEKRACLANRWKNGNDIEKDIKNLTWMSKYKLNRMYIGYGNLKDNCVWYKPSKTYKKACRKLGNFAEKYKLVEIATCVNPYSHLKAFSQIKKVNFSDYYPFEISNQKCIERLCKSFDEALSKGASTIMLTLDDHVPSNGPSFLFYEQNFKTDKEKFVSLADAHSYLINEIYLWLRANYPKANFEVVLPYYNNIFVDKSAGRGYEYLRQVSASIPEDISIVWTGPVVRSLYIDDVDVKRYMGFINNRIPMLWDNTLYARFIDSGYGYWKRYYVGKSRMLSLFEPYDISLPKSFEKLNHKKSMYINSALNNLYYVKFLTVADYEWNTDKYDPEKSIWKSLNKLYGYRGALALIEFNDIYYKLHDLKMRKKKGLLTDEKLITDTQEELKTKFDEVKKILYFKKELQTHLDKLTKDMLKQEK